MKLSLSVMSYHRFTSGVEDRKVFSGDSGESVLTIGRANQCSWCLPDPERVISSRHARIEFNQGQFWLYDTSTNGVFVNRSVEPIAKDKPYCLCDGDILVIGDYEIETSVIPSTVENKSSAIELVSAPKSATTLASEDFGVLLESAVVDEKATHLDSGLDANIEDAFVLPAALVSEELSNIPEDWNALFTPSPEPKKSDSVQAEKPQDVNTKSPAAVTGGPSEVRGRMDLSTEVPSASLDKAQPSAHPATAQDEQSVMDEQVHLNAFLEGMGISADLVSQENPARWWYQLGVITRDALDGIMNTLDNRAAFKQSSRINQTTFRKNENNPLKFSTNAEDAIHNLLQRKTAGFLPPERAVKEAFIDLERHEYALLSGIEGAVASVMQLLDPKSIESNVLNKQGLAKYYSALEKHKNWNRYCAVYSDLEHEFSQNSNAFYMEDFAKAYETTLKSIEQKGQR